MNLPSQLRLAAEIIEQKKEWEIKMETGWRPGEDMNIVRLVSEGYPIRLAPGAGPVPPEGWRLITDEERDGSLKVALLWQNGEWSDWHHFCMTKDQILAIPIPAQPATDQSTLDDALSYIRHLEEHLRDAQKEVTRLSKDCAEKQPATEEGLVDPPIPPLGDHITERVIVEESPSPWRLPAPPEGREWHRTDGWTQEMLPDGWRPILIDEEVQEGDEFRNNFGIWLTWMPSCGKSKIGGFHCLHRTRRPLPAPETRRVPLGPEDVPPLSCLRLIDDKGWSIVSSVGPEGLCIGVEDDDGYYFHNLVGKWEILRLGSTKWEPCYKTEL